MLKIEEAVADDDLSSILSSTVGVIGRGRPQGEFQSTNLSQVDPLHISFVY